MLFDSPRISIANSETPQPRPPTADGAVAHLVIGNTNDGVIGNMNDGQQVDRLNAALPDADLREAAQEPWPCSTSAAADPRSRR